MPEKVTREGAYRQLAKRAEKGKTPRIWMGADPGGPFHLGHVSTMLYGFSTAAPLAKETPVDFILALNDMQVNGDYVEEGIESFIGLAGAMEGYLNSRFAPPADKAPLGIRILKESEMISERRFRRNFGRLLKDESFTPICPRGHETYRTFEGGWRGSYRCSECEDEGRRGRYAFDPSDPEQLFELSDVMIVRDRYLSPGVHVVGGDWDGFECDLGRESPRLKVGVLVSPLLTDPDGYKMSKSLGNGQVPRVLEQDRLDALYELLMEGPDEIRYDDWRRIFGKLGMKRSWEY